MSDARGASSAAGEDGRLRPGRQGAAARAPPLPPRRRRARVRRTDANAKEGDDDAGSASSLWVVSDEEDRGHRPWVCGLMLLGAAPGWAKGRIAWHGCGPEHPSNLQCGELSVPLDYGDPDGAKITLGFNRLPARGHGTPGRQPHRQSRGTGRRRQPGRRGGGGRRPSLESRPARALRHDRHGPAWRRHEHADPVRPRRLQPAGRRCFPARRRSSTSSRHGRARSVRAASSGPARCSATWTRAAPRATWRRCAGRSATGS